MLMVTKSCISEIYLGGLVNEAHGNRYLLQLSYNNKDDNNNNRDLAIFM